ncbi:uncharacterized protein LOC127749271 [Frankliniella occidentalis]|uniref:Uncharacterized protein LOC127749271 n=1 Tax=Frankliniella occidentalis TaxID=133901 RepID=A0A9C6U7N0_FRAOC|nr:uncharacterized protein LOC127749271 [Frankliniella occidentalis]
MILHRVVRFCRFSGHFLFLNAQPNSSESLHLISPPYMFTAQQCMLRLSLHTANGSIAVFAESQQSNGSSVPWELAHNVSNTGSAWQQHNISIGSVAQTIRIVIEVTNVTRSTGHVAIDNLQLVRCFHGE